MIKRLACAAALAALAACGPGATTKSAAVDPLARGEYLVDSIGMCGDCHTVRLPTGVLDATVALHGAPLAFAPINPQPWAPNAPPLAGLPAGYTEAQLATLLQTGVRPDGSRPLPPMPEYRLSPEDAAAVATYIKSLPGPAASP